MEAMEKETLVIDAIVFCPDCEYRAVLHASRKGSTARLECDRCGIVDEGVIPYGAGVKAGDFDD
jgi:ribosomal protein S27AE